VFVILATHKEETRSEEEKEDDFNIEEILMWRPK
jgi:hypothetical protein